MLEDNIKLHLEYLKALDANSGAKEGELLS